MIEWLSQNYQFIVLCVSALISIVTLIVGIIKRKVHINMIDSALGSTLQKLPSFINEAELNIKDGKTKFAFVLAKAINDISLKTDIKPDDVVSNYGAVISDHIESILSCPQKKEVKNEEEIIKKD